MSHARNGFTLVEVMIVTVLAAAGLLEGFRAIEQARRAQDAVVGKLAARSALETGISQLGARPGEFPPVILHGRLCTYVRCITRRGLPSAGTRATREYFLATLADSRVASGLCAAGGTEIHITPLGGDGHATDVDVFQLTSPTAASYHHRRRLVLRGAL